MDEKIKELEDRIALMQDASARWDSDYPKFNPEQRLRLEISLIKHGCHVEQDAHGLLVNKKFIVAVSKQKWCVKGKYVWYWYKDIPTLVAQYINQGAPNIKDMN